MSQSCWASAWRSSAMLRAAARKCSGGKTSRFTAMPTVTPTPIWKRYPKENVSGLWPPTSSTRSAAVGIQSRPEPIFGSPARITPRPMTTATVSGVGEPRLNSMNASPTPIASPTSVWRPWRMDPATFSYMATRAPRGA